MQFKKLLPVTLLAFGAITVAAQTGASTAYGSQSQSTKTQTVHAKPKPKAASGAKPARKPGTTAAKSKVAKVATANPQAIFDTSMGKLKCELFPKQAPKTVENFIALAKGTKEWTNPQTGKKSKSPLYDNTIFHRVIPNFMIQGGDPIGNGTGDPGYRFEDEFVPELRFDRPGRLAMANSGPGTNGSQFFITEVPTPHLNDHHTIFGQCDDPSVEIVKQIARVAADPRNNRPDTDVKLNHIEITGVSASKNKPTAVKHGTKHPVKKKTATAVPVKPGSAK